MTRVSVNTSHHASPSIVIAGHEVSMNDIFNKPEEVNELKELQNLIDDVNEQMLELSHRGQKPTALLISPRLMKSIRHNASPELYLPVHQSQNNLSDVFMGLTIGVIQNYSRDYYIKVV